MANRNEDEIRDDLYEAALQPMSLDNKVVLLIERVKVLTRTVKEEREENKKLSARLAKLEVAYQRGFGVFLVFPFIGGFIGFLATYWSTIFKPWSGK